ncbi:MAG: flagellar basal body rod protein FlgB [Planctomycetota bacterium]
MPALERMVQFTEARQQVLAHNVANLSTPDFQPRDLDVAEFQQTLGNAMDRRRNDDTTGQRPLDIDNTDHIEFRPGRLVVKPAPTHENVVFHDGNNRNLERIMQDVAENVMAHQFGVTLLKNQFDNLRTAIRERL